LETVKDVAGLSFDVVRTVRRNEQERSCVMGGCFGSGECQVGEKLERRVVGPVEIIDDRTSGCSPA
jgi:hypothetical protein